MQIVVSIRKPILETANKSGTNGCTMIDSSNASRHSISIPDWSQCRVLHSTHSPDLSVKSQLLGTSNGHVLDSDVSQIVLLTLMCCCCQHAYLQCDKVRTSHASTCCVACSVLRRPGSRVCRSTPCIPFSSLVIAKAMSWHSNSHQTCARAALSLTKVMTWLHSAHAGVDVVCR